MATTQGIGTIVKSSILIILSLNTKADQTRKKTKGSLSAAARMRDKFSFSHLTLSQDVIYNKIQNSSINMAIMTR
jgi:hypothetical protein